MIPDSDKYGRVGVLMGGPSAERSISLKSGEAVFRSLKGQGVDVCVIDLISSEASELRSKVELEGCSLVFNALHGEYGEDGGVQRVLTEMGILFTGSDEVSSRKAFHKPTTQNILRDAGIQVPRHVSISKDSSVSFEEVSSSLASKKCVLKPVSEGSSIGVHIVHDQRSFDWAKKDAFQYSSSLMMEEYIEGREMTVGILNGASLPVIEITPKVAFFDYKAKYEKGMSAYQVPAILDPSEVKYLQSTALEAYTLLGCRHFGRVDFILKNQTAYCLEINTIPGFTQTSLLPKAAASLGIMFDQLTLQILECAYAEKKENKSAMERA